MIVTLIAFLVVLKSQLNVCPLQMSRQEYGPWCDLVGYFADLETQILD